MILNGYIIFDIKGRSIACKILNFQQSVDIRQTSSYSSIMTVFYWNNEKNEWLKENRGVCFEQVVLLMEREEVLEVLEHPNQEKYPGQRIAIVEINEYAYLVPYVQEGDEIFLKTIIPSRKATSKYVRVDR
jgi:uncharacterized DUF497 family protein